MSNRNLGIVQEMLFLFGNASSLHFFNAVEITDEDIFRPRILFASSTPRLIFVVLFAPEICTDVNKNPAFCRVAATTDNVSSAVFLSVAVTSTRRFFVDVETVVSAELIIGGNDIVFPFASKIIGTDSAFSSSLPYCMPTSVFCSISDMDFSVSEPSGTNLCSLVAVV